MTKEKRLIFGTTLKYLNSFDMALAKLAIISFVLFVLSVFPVIANWVTNTPWLWFLAAWIIFAIIPITKLWRK